MESVKVASSAVDRANDDSDLRDGLFNGQQHALAELFDRHRERLWKIIYFRTNARLAARLDPDDILQEAFLDASARLRHYGRQKQFSPFVWLRMIVAQTMIDAHRRHLGAQQRDARRETTVAATFPNATSLSLADILSAHLTSPSLAAIRTEQSSGLRGAIETMEPIDSEILALRHFEELSNQEVAEVLDISQKAASIRYVRAVARLKKILVEQPAFAHMVSPSNDKVARNTPS